MNNQKCSGCIFYKDMNLPDIGVPLGDCRRHAPVAGSPGRNSRFPQVSGDQWCGDFKAKRVDVSFTVNAVDEKALSAAIKKFQRELEGMPL